MLFAFKSSVQEHVLGHCLTYTQASTSCALTAHDTARLLALLSAEVSPYVQSYTRKGTVMTSPTVTKTFVSFRSCVFHSSSCSVLFHLDSGVPWDNFIAVYSMAPLTPSYFI